MLTVLGTLFCRDGAPLVSYVATVCYTWDKNEFVYLGVFAPIPNGGGTFRLSTVCGRKLNFDSVYNFPYEPCRSKTFRLLEDSVYRYN